MERTQVSIARKPAAAARSKSRPVTAHRQTASVMRVLRPGLVENSASETTTATTNHSLSHISPSSESLLSRQCDECAEEVQKKPQQSLPAISEPSDPLELEAERVADSVMAQTDRTAYSPFATQSNAAEVQRACASCEEETEIQRVTAEPLVQSANQTTEPELQRLCSECEEEQLQRYAQAEQQTSSESQTQTRPGLWQRIKSAFRTGRYLPKSAVNFFKARMGYDFSRVQIHTHQQAAESAQEIHARAFTWRDHIAFAPGEYQPETSSGLRLLAHELTHVVQQGAVQTLAPAALNTAVLNADVLTAEPVNSVNQIASVLTPAVPLTNTAPAEISNSSQQVQRNWAGDAWDAAGDAVGAVGDAAVAVGGAVVDAGEAVIEAGADFVWSYVEDYAPELARLITEIREKGFFGYLREKIEAVTQSIFDGLEDQSGFVATLLTTFSRLAVSATTILAGLAQGDCEPLFAALRSMRDAVTELANDAWTAISDFFRPIGEFFSNLWQRFGAPVIEWLQEVAGDAWQFIQELGQDIWNWASPVVNAVRDVMSDAWNWIKAQLGLPDDEGNDQNGLIQWVQGKAQEAWTAIKTELAPVIEPIQAVITKVQEILPLEAILNFRETVNGWLQQVAETARNMDTSEGGDVAENQTTLRELLPAILLGIQNFRTTLIDTGSWIAEKIGGAVDTGKQFINALVIAPLLNGLSSVFSWLSTGLDSIGSWARETVQGLFSALGDALVYLSHFIEPVLNALQRIVSVVGDLLGRLPDFLLGPLWALVPDCIKNPLKDFFVEQIIGRIPLFQQLVAAGDIWQRVQTTALAILRQIFVDGDLFGAAWRFFREMLGLIGIPAQLLVQIVANAAQAFSDILMDPIGFLGNLLRSMWQGVTQFFGNIFTHLFGGVTGWLFSKITEAGLTPPDITSFRSIIGFVFELLGLTLENIWRLLAVHVGQPMVERIRGAVELASGAWEFIQVAIMEGLPGLWRMIQERISDLWNMVLTSAVNWINTAIIGTASRWLMSLLDVTGIMPVINALIAIYHAIESFAQYMVEMLGIINSVVAGIADIARGMIDTAANYLETTMADAMPIVIGFLANQFGFGNLGERIRELVESIRERVNGALDSIIGAAVRAGRAFLDMLRAGAAAVRNWWESRKEFRDSEGHSHELYFQSERGELIVESTPTPVNIFLENLVIADADPQRAQKQTHKTQAVATLREIQSIKQRLASAAEGADTTALRAELTQKVDLLATHLTPLLGVGDASGRLPNPLTLNNLNDVPVTTPRSADEERIDLNGARQMILLAVEATDGTDALAEYFLRIKNRFALSEVVYQTSGEITRVKLRATQEQMVDINSPLKGTTSGLTLASNLTPTGTSGSAAGFPVGVTMVADPVGPDKINQGSPPARAALGDVMKNLVTNPRRPSVSRYIKGHLLNHHIGGLGNNANMYPITAAANSAHLHQIETQVKNWVIQHHYWVYYSVDVNNIQETIPQPGKKDPANFINARFNCYAYIKNADGTKRDEIRRPIDSIYTQYTSPVTESDSDPIPEGDS
ncbi:eCIS core domain-containing protein [Cellvibrio sp. NN19]|uniref:eCIS core domain-containing protein n=1 Tax=Cellvibrio chitinivorans TaxID=3102792 RepID=UPI002B404533|nr:DUF4157 domain-containing protein [Cellvibrio sp. NN19]